MVQGVFVYILGMVWCNVIILHMTLDQNSVQYGIIMLK